MTHEVPALLPEEHQAIETDVQPKEKTMTDAGLIAIACGLIIGMGVAMMFVFANPFAG